MDSPKLACTVFPSVANIRDLDRSLFALGKSTSVGSPKEFAPPTLGRLIKYC